MANLEIKIGIIYQPIDPDGSECIFCDDRCYLSQFEMVATINGKPTSEPIGSLCAACRKGLEVDD